MCVFLMLSAVEEWGVELQFRAEGLGPKHHQGQFCGEGYEFYCSSCHAAEAFCQALFLSLSP